MNYGEMQEELQKRLIDLAQMKHAGPRYGEVLNVALSAYPRVLWPLAVDGTTLDTVDGTFSYALSGIAAITDPEQVRRVWVDNSDGEPIETGRYEIQDNAGSLSLVFDEEPDDAYDITIEYRTPPDTMSSDEDTTEADETWLLDRATWLLLTEADPSIEDPAYIATLIERYAQRWTLRDRELKAERRRSSRKPRSTPWRKWVR